MKIHQITIENIASLRNSHHIDFDNNLKDEGLFAITGPTGSGKSSILTAISLALYGKNHKGLNQTDFVTLGEKSARVDLHFSTTGKKYLARWKCRTHKKDGTPLKNPSIDRQLFLNDEALSGKAEDIINLNLDQFCKTVILNQGEFAKFLMSSFTERRDILEKLYNGENLSLLGRNLKKNIKELNEQINLQLQKLELFSEYSEEDINEFSKSLENNSKFLSKYKPYVGNLSEFISSIKDLISNLQTLTDSTEKVEINEKDLKEIVNDLNASKELLSKAELSYLDLTKNYKEISPKLREAIKIQSNITSSQKNILDQQKTISKLISVIDDTKKDIEGLTDKINKISKEMSQLESNPKINLLTDAELKDLERIIKTLSDTQYNQDLFNQNLLNLNEKIEDIEKRGVSEKAEYTEALDALPAFSNKYLQHYQIENSNHHQELTTFYKENIDQLRKNSVLLNSLNENVETHNTNLKQKREKHKRLLNLEKTLLTNKETINRQIQNSEKELSLNKLTESIHNCLEESLKDGTCVVCHSKIDKDKLAIDDSTIDIAKIKNEREILLNDRLQLEKDLSSNQSTQESTLKDIDSLEEKLKKAQKEIDKIKDQTNNNFDPEALKQDERNYVALYQKYNLLDKQIEKTRAEYQMSLDKLQELRSKIDKNNEVINNLIDDVKTIISSYPSTVTQIQDRFEQDKRDTTQFKHLKTKLQGIKGQAESKEKHINDNQEQINTLEQEIKLKNESIKTLQKEFKAICQDKDPTKELEKLELEVENARVKKDKLVRECSEKDKDRTKLSSRIKLLKDQIDDINMSRATILTNSKKSISFLTNFEHNIQFNSRLQNSFSTYISKFLNIEYKHDLKEEFPKLKLFFEDIITPYNEEITIYYRDIEMDTHTLREKIETFEKRKKERDETQKTLEDLTKKVNRLQNLFKVIGLNEFRDFSLAFIEKQLIAHTNYELDSLCNGRYELVHEQESKEQHEFYVIDHWGGGLKRKVTTLSGGETFLVSLAMALSLAEMTRGQTEIDSFFIDEGFGTLDNDSINEVLEVLMNIRNRGKQIGVISHVKSFTDRIPINIQVTKSQLGEGHIDFVRNN